MQQLRFTVFCSWFVERFGFLRVGRHAALFGAASSPVKGSGRLKRVSGANKNYVVPKTA